MANIEVYRGKGDVRGLDIIAPMLSDSVLLDRGIAEMNANAQQVNDITLSVVYRSGLRLGQIIEVMNPTGNYFAKITGMSINLSHGDAQLNLNLERPL